VLQHLRSHVFVLRIKFVLPDDECPVECRIAGFEEQLWSEYSAGIPGNIDMRPAFSLSDQHSRHCFPPNSGRPANGSGTNRADML
jgi:hypothetical protein